MAMGEASAGLSSKICFKLLQRGLMMDKGEIRWMKVGIELWCWTHGVYSTSDDAYFGVVWS